MDTGYSDIPGDGAAVGDLLSRMIRDGMRSVLFVGPTGAPKVMLARRLLGVLPEPESDEAQVIRLAALEWRARFGSDYPEKRPFRAPHHTVSRTALMDSARCEYRAAAAGVLYLDDVTEFRAAVLSDTLHRFNNTGAADPYAPRLLAAGAIFDETRDRPAYREIVERVAEHFDATIYVTMEGCSKRGPRLVLQSVRAGRLSPGAIPETRV